MGCTLFCPVQFRLGWQDRYYALHRDIKASRHDDANLMR
jgi:hypothetical protein